VRKVEAAGELAHALAAAIEGRPAALHRMLETRSGLPGPRMNLPLATAFADACVGAGAKADAVAYALASLPPDEARGASPKEFLTVAGLLAVAARAVASKDEAAIRKAFALLEDKAEDPRFRVRDAVPTALAALGRASEEIASSIEPWMDRYFHAAAVLRAMAEKQWLETLAVSDVPMRTIAAAFRLAHDAPRSAFRYPGHKALIDALVLAAQRFLRRFPMPMFDQLRTWADEARVPELREVVRVCVTDPQTNRAPSPEAKRVLATLDGSATPPRDPTRIVHGTRGRGKKRSAR
jgi:hypothetical protein